ncbi:family S53 protease [Mycena vitilis]|nr:family S53 protease [Mycena vitilis]
MFRRLTVLLSLLVGVHCELVLLGKRDAPPPGFARIGAAPVNEVLNLRLALAPSNIQGLEDTVYDVSTPGNARYGQYLTQDEVSRFVAPSAETLSQVDSWLTSNNLTASPITLAGDWISVNITVARANALLAADFSTFQNQQTNGTVVRTLAYSIPSGLKSSIQWVHPIISFPNPQGVVPSSIRNTPTTPDAQPSVSSVSADCRSNSSWTVSCIQELYGIPKTPATPANNVFAVSGFANDFANNRDLKAFLETYRPDLNPNTTFDFISVDDGINNQLPAGAGLTADADVELAIGLATGIPVTFISTGTLPNDAATELLDQAHYLLSLENPPQTVLNSFTIGLESQVATPEMAVSLCNAYAQLAARGVSYITQTGIFGAGGVPTADCKPFDPPFQATCPFVTAVGATEFSVDEVQETVAQFSGGGFSNLFKRPRYQDAAVAAYLDATGNTGNTAFNTSGRAVPDVSAISSVDWIIDGGVIDFFETPENSAAIFASIVALLTNKRIVEGKPGLGFLNPLIYANPDAFTDFTTGNNPGCNTPGFNATSGWDPVGGLGSPLYTKLEEIVNQL